MATVRALPSGNLYIDFRVEGQRFRETTPLIDSAANRKRLEALAKVIDAELTLGSFDYLSHFPKGKNGPAIDLLLKRTALGIMGSNLPTVTLLADAWFAEHEVEWRTNYSNVISGILATHIKPGLGSYALDEITREIIVSFRNTLVKKRSASDRALKPGTINRIMTVLKAIIEDGCFKHKLPTPFDRVKKLKEEKRHIQPFSIEEMNRILDDVRRDYRDYLVVKFFTGLRTSEANGLRWKHIDFNREEILIRETLSKGQREYTKTDSSQREVRMTAMVKEALQRQLKITGHRGPEGLVFCTRTGGSYDDHNFVNRIWKPMLEDLEIPYRRPYNTRHTAATIMLAAGESPEWIARQLGHVDTKMLFTVYSRYVPNLTRNDGSALDRLIGKTVSINEEAA